MTDYLEMVIQDQMSKLKYCREHQEICSEQIKRILNAFTDEQIEQKLRERLLKAMEVFEKTVVGAIDGKEREQWGE